MGDTSPDRRSSCGLLTAVFGGRRGFWPRRSTSTGSLPAISETSSTEFVRTPSTPNSKRRRNGSTEIPFQFDSSQDVSSSTAPSKPINKPPPSNNQRAVHVHVQNQNKNQNQNQNQNQNSQNHSRSIPTYQVYVNQGRRVPKDAVGISGELESMIADHQKNRGSNTLVRASSSNVMLHGNLGNLRQPGGGNNINSNKVLDYLPKTAREDDDDDDDDNDRIGQSTMRYGRYANDVGKTSPSAYNKPSIDQQPSSLCRALSTRMDPETLKILGNEDYKNGRFAEALALYDAAISIDPNKASYRSNKSAALTALGRILEAVFECREAIRIEPQYQRAHQRLANLYLRLGETEKATYHYKHAGPEADPDVLNKVRSVQVHLNKCTEARRLRDWNTLIKETRNAISAGADSAPQIYALQAEALMKLHRHEEADQTLSSGPDFDVDSCTKFLGPISNANVVAVRAQVDMAAGRFDDALAGAQRATRLDSNNREANMVLRKARAISAARSKGNELFKAARFPEASNAYSEGLEHDPYNSVLLCNRAACWSKLDQFDKAINDCSAALHVRPSYSKARLRRADCNYKLENWEACVQDYEVLIKETPEDEEVIRALSEAKAKLGKRQHGKAAKHVESGGGNDIAL
nr:TPR repeat-containing thioredoxin TTL4-like [Ziziphus jujuba var. spinosa]